MDYTLPDYTNRDMGIGHRMLTDLAVIRGLPDNLRQVPENPVQWRAWRTAVAAYREKRRRECLQDTRQQDIEFERCRRDPAYWFAMYAVIFEPRTVEGQKPQWKPFIPFPFQVQMIRWIEHVMSLDPEASDGRGDGVIEKSRDMGATNIFCAWAVWRFLFSDVFVCGFISRNFDLVDRRGSTDTLFYKLRSNLGVEDAVPMDLRLPRWMQPPGFDDPFHRPLGSIQNSTPGKTCFLIGETTTKLSGVGGRSTVRINDEAARFDSFQDAWANQQATTDHRFALSSADLRFGPAFKNLAELGQKASLSPDIEGPSYLRLEWHLHPLHTPEWFEGQKARAGTDLASFQREYEINYEAEMGASVYPRFQEILPINAPYDPYGGPVYCFIDPGTRDPAAIIWAQVDPEIGGWKIVEAFEGHGGEDVMFYASVLTGVYLSGERQYDYDAYARLHHVMEFTGNISQEITYIGDPAGTQRGGRGDEWSTWFRELTVAAKRISSKTIHVNSITANNARAHETRKLAVNALLPRVRFHIGEGPTYVLHCLKQSRYRKPPRGVEENEPMKPLHDRYSHMRTAYEWGMVYLWMILTAAQHERDHQHQGKQLRVSMSGNLVSGGQRELFDGPSPRRRNKIRSRSVW